MNVLAIDPGHTQSAWIKLVDDLPDGFGIEPNVHLLDMLYAWPGGSTLVVEQVASFGMPVGAEVFETVHWAGRFAEAWDQRGWPWDRITRMAVKMALCHHSRAKDANVRQALIDRYGGKEVAVGIKARPGPLYGVSKDVWSALAVAVAWQETRSGALLEHAE